MTYVYMYAVLNSRAFIIKHVKKNILSCVCTKQTYLAYMKLVAALGEKGMITRQSWAGLACINMLV